MARAAAWNPAAGWADWNMSQSGTAKVPTQRELKALSKTCRPWTSGLAGKKSWDERQTAGARKL